MNRTTVWLIFVIVTVIYFTVAFTATWFLHKTLSSHFMALFFLAIVAIYACFFTCVIVIRIFSKPRANENDSLENCEPEMHSRFDMVDRFQLHQPTGNDLHIQIIPLQVTSTVCSQLPIALHTPVHHSRSYPVILPQFNPPGASFESVTNYPHYIIPKPIQNSINNPKVDSSIMPCQAEKSLCNNSNDCCDICQTVRLRHKHMLRKPKMQMREFTENTSPTKRCARLQSVNSEIQNLKRANLGRQGLRRSVSSPNPLQRGRPFQVHDLKANFNDPSGDTTYDLKSGRVCGLAKLFHDEARLSAIRKVHKICKNSSASSGITEQAESGDLVGSSSSRSLRSNDPQVACSSTSDSRAILSVSEAPLNICNLSPSEYQKRRIKRTYSNQINQGSKIAQVRPAQHSFSFP